MNDQQNRVFDKPHGIILCVCVCIFHTNAKQLWEIDENFILVRKISSIYRTLVLKLQKVFNFM